MRGIEISRSPGGIDTGVACSADAGITVSPGHAGRALEQISKVFLQFAFGGLMIPVDDTGRICAVAVSICDCIVFHVSNEDRMGIIINPDYITWFNVVYRSSGICYLCPGQGICSGAVIGQFQGKTGALKGALPAVAEIAVAGDRVGGKNLIIYQRMIRTGDIRPAVSIVQGVIHAGPVSMIPVFTVRELGAKLGDRQRGEGGALSGGCESRDAL